jgi:hypothetical protein
MRTAVESLRGVVKSPSPRMKLSLPKVRVPLASVLNCGFLVVMDTVPPGSLRPKSDEAGPLRISIFSTAEVSRTPPKPRPPLKPFTR